MSEQENLEKTLGKSLSEIRKIISEKYDYYNIYIQGQTAHIEKNKKFISIYSNIENINVIERPLDISSIITEEIYMEEKLKEGETDIYRGINKYLIKEYINQYNQLIAGIDSIGNIYFCDFIHNGNNKYSNMFWKILEKEQDNNSIIQDLIEKINKIKGVNIKEIVVEFDKEKYLKEVEEKILLWKEKEKINKNILIETIKENYQKEIEQIKKDTQENLFKLFQMMKEMESKWNFEINDKNNLLLKYKKEIICEKIKKGDIIKSIPKNEKNFFIEGLSLNISSELKITKAISNGKSFHPNAGSAFGGEVCIGEMLNKKFNKENINKIIKMLDIANLDSAFSNEATSYAEEIFKKIKEENKIWKI